MLLSFPDVLKSQPDAEKLVRSGVDFMLTLEQKNFNYPPAMDEVGAGRPDSEELVHWCHGAPGWYNKLQIIGTYLYKILRFLHL